MFEQKSDENFQYSSILFCFKSNNNTFTLTTTFHINPIQLLSLDYLIFLKLLQMLVFYQDPDPKIISLFRKLQKGNLQELPFGILFQHVLLHQRVAEIQILYC